MSESGTIRAMDDERMRAACAIAGVLAQCGVAELAVQDPRVCMPRRIRARETNLPRELVEAAPGTTFSAEGVALQVDDAVVRWVASDTIAAALRTITPA